MSIHNFDSTTCVRKIARISSTTHRKWRVKYLESNEEGNGNARNETAISSKRRFAAGSQGVVLQKRTFYGGGCAERRRDSSQSRDKFASSEAAARSQGVFAPVLARRSFRFRWLQRFLRFFRDAAVICHVVGGERLRCICNFTRRLLSLPLSRLVFVSSDLFPRSDRSFAFLPLPLFLLERFRKRGATLAEFEKFWRTGGGGGGRERGRRWPNYSPVPQMIVPPASFPNVVLGTTLNAPAK